MLKKLHVNVPFLDALSQMPLYVKFSKEILSKKRKVDEHGTVALVEECSIVVLNQLPTKLKDPDNFSIACMIRSVSIDRALCDLGSSVSLMPYSFFKRLGLGELRPTSIFFQLADRSIKYYLGILEDVPLKVSDFYVPIDFVILDMPEDSHTQIILGRPLLATAGCTIDVKEGKLTFDVGEKHAKFGLLKDFKPSPSIHSCCGCEVLASNEPVSMLDVTLNDPSSFDCTLFEGPGHHGVTVNSLPPSLIEDNPYVVDEDYVSYCYRFITFMMSMPLMSEGVHELDLDFELEFRPFDGGGPRMIVFQDSSL